MLSKKTKNFILAAIPNTRQGSPEWIGWFAEGDVIQLVT